ncbi:TPR repeat region-containing protein [Rhodococcus sp. W8901]|uniref:TPR repeat region-containing protein n=1 Tax=Rhodococcus sp. W8901 TaxID=2742603 RepID=UPI00158228B8|nr:hypothetical protein [Rhodococcus sp. W8901]QKT13185.1 hypothetical protein HUN07_22835 [Rhodococcus sp. W8901]
MTLSRSQIESWNPATLNDVADAWEAFGSKVEGLFDRYVEAVTRVNDGYWEGRAAEAAQDRATSDRKTALAVVDRLGSLAARARQGFFEIDAPLSRARNAIAGAEGERFAVSSALQLTDTLSESSPERIAALRQWQGEITAAANDVEMADRSVREALGAHRSELRAMFVSVAALGAEQGRTDGELIASGGEVSAESVRRLVEAGTLDPAQLAALSGGHEAPIPASHMEYLNQVARSLDGKSPREIEELMGRLPEEGRRALANSLQIVSNERVIAGVAGDPEVPTSGGADLLPDRVRESLTRDDLVVREFKMIAGTGSWSAELNGVSDNQAIARIVESGDALYKTGSELDRRLLDAGRQYLDAQVAHEQNPNNKFEYFAVDGRGSSGDAVAEQIFDAVGDDKAAVLDAVTGKHGGDLVRDMLAHDWTDDGKAASSMFRFSEQDFTVEDPNNPEDVARATQAGKLMAGVGEHLSTADAWKTLSDIPGANGQSAGQVNPELLRTLSHSLSPYLPGLTGAEMLDRPGFAPGDWADPSDNGHYNGTANIFALMNTDGEAGRHFTAAAQHTTLDSLGAYAKDPSDPHASYDLVTAGRLMGLVDRGLLIETQNEYQDSAEAAKAAYERKAAAYSLATTVGTYGLDKAWGGDAFSTLVDAGGDTLKESIIGKAPGEADRAVLTGPDFPAAYHAVLAATPDIPDGVRSEYKDLFDDQGNLRPYDAIDSRGDRWKTDLRAVFNKIGDPTDGHGSLMQEMYNEVVRNDG